MQINLHKGQLAVHDDDHRFQVLSCGRRWGKTFYTCFKLLSWAAIDTCPNGTSLINSPVGYIAPTNKKAMSLMYRPLKALLKDLGLYAGENKKDQILDVKNGRQIMLAGADNPDSLRGESLYGLGVDECKDVKLEVFNDVLRPCLIDKQSPALYIGTPPRGKGGPFYDLYMRGLSDESKWRNWKTFHGTTWDNPTIPRSELEEAKESLPPDVYRREILGEFVSQSGDYFTHEMFEIVPPGAVPQGGSVFIAMDIAGFTVEQDKARDDTVIAVVNIASDGTWYVLDMPNGKWDPRMCALSIMQMVKRYQPVAVGAEHGALRQAVLPYLDDMQKRFGIHFDMQPLSHGGNKKLDRIIWALQGRAHKGMIKLVQGDWNEKLIDQACDFPDPFSHDDMIDALAYIDHLGGGTYFDFDELGSYYDDWEPVDEYAGY